ncbi:isoaspartyl peptidase/L-asparaginase [Caldiplasma sukawensis]
MENVIVVHGGVGRKNSESISMEDFCKNSVSKSPIDSVESAVSLLEDDPRFNAGTGSVMRVDGSIQMDAAISYSGNFGAVGAIEYVKNPIKVARKVMEITPHILLVGDGATSFARKLGFEYYDPATDRARKRREELLNAMNGDLSDEMLKLKNLIENGIVSMGHDTVGAVARINGSFAAAVSTGGASPMMRGRIGDVPINGAGIYCGEKGAVVATGHGESIAKRLLCFRVHERIGKGKLKDILEEEIQFFKEDIAGLIAVSKDEVAYHSNGSMPVGEHYFRL